MNKERVVQTNIPLQRPKKITRVVDNQKLSVVSDDFESLIRKQLLVRMMLAKKEDNLFEPVHDKY